MKRKFNFCVLLAILVVIFSLTGCGSNTASNHETKKETKTVEVTAKADNKAEQDTKQENAVDQTKPAAAPAVTAEKQQAASKPADSQTKSGQSAQPVPKSSAQTEPTTPAPTSKNSATATAKPAGTTPSSTTNPAAKATTSTSAKTTTTTTTTTTQTTTTAPVVKPAVPAPKPITTVTLSIVGPKDKGTILAPSKIKINDGDTIFDVIKRTNLDIDSSGSGATAYIEGIDNIYEFDYGAKSGWVFKLNGVSITKSIGVIKVKAGDRIECYYTE